MRKSVVCTVLSFHIFSSCCLNYAGLTSGMNQTGGNLVMGNRKYFYGDGIMLISSMGSCFIL